MDVIIVAVSVAAHIDTGVYDINKITDPIYQKEQMASDDIEAMNRAHNSPLGMYISSGGNPNAPHKDTSPEIEESRRIMRTRTKEDSYKTITNMVKFIKDPSTKKYQTPDCFRYRITRSEKGDINILPGKGQHDPCPTTMTYYEYIALSLLIGYRYGFVELVGLNDFGFLGKDISYVLSAYN